MTGIAIRKYTIFIFCCLSLSTEIVAQSFFTIRNADSVFMVKNPVTQDHDQVFVGNVFLEEKAKEIKFFCDSAYKHSDTQIIEAYGKVQVNRGDTIDLQGEYMSFDLNTNFLKVRKNAKLEHAKATLLTDSLDYNLDTEIGAYNYGGKLIDSTSVLSSRVGTYYASNGDVLFKQNVVITGEDYKIITDSLRYNVNSNEAFIISPTDFVSEDYQMYTERGVYNTNTGISNFTKATKLINESYVLTGDNLNYDEKTGIGILTKNCELVDTVNNMVLKSDYMKSVRQDSSVLAVDSIELQYIMEKDTLFAHSDTIFVHKDTLHRQIMEVYRKVKFFKPDFQGKCDSLSFTEADSTMRMYYDPTIWSGTNQLTADTITAEFVNEKLKHVNLLQNAFTIASEDSTQNFYNQMKGREMKAFIDNDTLHTIEVYGNGESLYFVKDDGKLTGVNHIRSSDITIRLNDQKLSTIIFRTKPTGTMHPVSNFDKIALLLNGFRWDEANRPRRREDIFEWNLAPPVEEPAQKRGVITEDNPEEEKNDEDLKNAKQRKPLENGGEFR
ncbi:OstA-like protein [Balneicella halophila]|uniref:OstA-like protein n=1 Tax=Balneicella halophila TaxID=1537566 RepID=A0A7L4UN88_BALHA|nr:OstA-like protein [Balneicella halophila]PVX50094.1 OstA-like protein [Balneicella halophila]